VSTLAERVANQAMCTRCGAQLAVDQEWCLECGTAVNSPIRPAPDWRVPVAIVGGVVALTAAAFVFLLASLSNSANQSATAVVAAAPVIRIPPAASTTSHPASTTSRPASTTASSSTTPASTTPTPSTGALGSWPKGVTGFTVVLTDIPSKAAATASATKIAAAGIPVGMLFSSDYSSMRPGDWIVFSGTYTTRAQAAVAATQLQAKGQAGAYAFSVVPAG
jgi:ribosomal protein L40E